MQKQSRILQTAEINKFWKLAAAGRSVALDINSSGQLLARFTVSTDAQRVEGAGTPPTTMSDDWQRIATCAQGKVTEHLAR